MVLFYDLFHYCGIQLIVSDGSIVIVNSHLYLYDVGLFNNFANVVQICLIIPVLYFYLVAHTVCLVHKLPLHVFYGADLEQRDRKSVV